MNNKLDMKTASVAQGNIEKIRQLFPDAVTEVDKDGKMELAIDFDVLKQELSESLIDEGKERYQMTWPGKRQAVVLANTSTTDTLRPCKEESVDFDNTQNIYIEGDNLNVLKLLRETYLGKVKMIYIDPPYNTGNDSFVYNDCYSMNEEEFLKAGGYYDEDGNRVIDVKENKESNGRFHTDWLNMLYPRLRLARDLLTDDGVIFISIDDNEQANLKKICDEVFGESNFITYFLWTKTSTPPALSYKCRKTVEFILCYEKNHTNYQYYGSLLDGGDAPLLNSGNPIKELIFKKGIVKFTFTNNTVIEAGKYDKVELLDDIIVQNGMNANQFRMRAAFKWGQEMLEDEIALGTYFLVKTEKLSIRFQRVFDENRYKCPNNFLNIELSRTSEIGTNESAVKELNELSLGGFFDFPKPTSLIKYLIQMIAKFDKNSIVLDFFSGSATTAHAVMQLNAEDGGNRKFIMVQLPEKCDEKSEAYKAGYKNICEIGKERIRRAGTKIVEEQAHLLSAVKSGAFEKGKPFAQFTNSESAKAAQAEIRKTLDIGFRVLKLDSSNMQDVYYNPAAVSQTLLDATIDNIKPDRTPLDLLFQVMLELGVPLSAKIEENAINGKTYYAVNGNDIIACFDDDINEEVITAIAKQQPLYVVFKDQSFASDSVAINNEQLFKTYSPATVIKVI